MNKTSKILLVISGIGLATLLAVKAKDMLNFVKLLSFTPKIDGGIKKFKLSLTKLTVPFALDIHNRTNQEAKIQLSAVTLYYQGKKVAQTKPTNAAVIIKGNTTSTLSGIKIETSILQLVSIVGTAIKTLISGGKTDEIVKDMTFDVAGILNDSIVVNLTDMKIGKQKDIQADSGAVAGLMGLDGKKKKKKGIGRKIFAVATANPFALIRRNKKKKKKVSSKASGVITKTKTDKELLEHYKKRIALYQQVLDRSANQSQKETAENTIKYYQKKIANLEAKMKQGAVGFLGLVAKSKRKISPISDVEMYLPSKSELKHRDLIMIPNGTVSDTVNLMKEIAVKYKGDTTELAKHLQKSTMLDTIQNVFNFVYKYIQYEPDNRTIEQVRRPLRTLYDQKGDCDCYATLIASIFENLGIRYKFRIADYGRGWQHVYVIVPNHGGYYVCDPVLDKCFSEKTTVNHRDY